MTRIKPTLLSLLACALCAAPAHAATLPQISGPVDLANAKPNSVVDGTRLSDGSAQVVADVGDVNGDGLEDTVTTAPYADPNGRRDAGSAFIVFGRTDGASIDLAALGSGGFRVDGVSSFEHLGWSAAPAGDVNGDGLADIVIGSKDADYRGRSNAGSAYVVFGRRSTSAVDTANLGPNGFRIDGAHANDSFGAWVAGGRDVNGDGRADVLVGAPLADHNGRASSGSVYAIFGKADTGGVDAAALGSAGLVIDGAAANDRLGTAAAFTSDLTADGLSDVLAGAPGADGGRGAAYVVAGQSGTAAVDLATPGAAFYTVTGAAAGDAAGSAVEQGGDFDGDGTPDLIVGAPNAGNNGRADSGSAYILFGARLGGTTDLAIDGSAWRIDGQAAGDEAGTAIDGGGDLNADGRPDLVVGSPYNDSRGRTNNGSVRVFYGGGFGGVIDLADTGAPGFRADGSGSTDNAGNSVGFSRDVNGDGWPDLLVGAWRSDHLRRGDSGSLYYLWGYGPSNLEYPDAVATTVGQPIAPLAPEAIQRTGIVAFSISPALPSGLSLNASSGVISGSPTVIVEQPSTYTLTMTDFAHSVSVPVTLRVAPLPGPCANTRDGGDGADKIVGTSGGDRSDAGAGDDSVQGLGGDDCEFGDADADTLSGDDGSDEMHGGDAHDSLDGGAGDDRLYGDPGQDTLTGDAGNDLMYGGTGYDDMSGGEGNDRIYGDSDSDVLQGGTGDDRLDGGAMADKLVGGPGKDLLLGGAGNDIINDSSGANRIDAGTGNDAINVRNRARDVVRCGKGTDHVSADRGDKLIGCEKVKRAGAAKKKRKKRG